MKKIAVVIGHDMKSPGAWSPFLKKTEYTYNSEVAEYLKGVADIYHRPGAGGYNSQMRKLAETLNPKKYDLVIELHFNSFDKIANLKGVGTEVIIYPGNEKTKEFGKAYCEVISKKYDTINRGVKDGYSGGRGWGFLSLIQAPTIIVEPFFGDEAESERFDNPGAYAEIIKDLICNY